MSQIREGHTTPALKEFFKSSFSGDTETTALQDKLLNGIKMRCGTVTPQMEGKFWGLDTL